MSDDASLAGLSAPVKEMVREKNAMIRRLATKVGVHADTAEAVTMQFAGALLSTVGGVSAAAIDMYWGQNTGASGIPELTLGPIPVVALAGVALKATALAMHAAQKGQSSAGDFLGHYADGVLAGAAALTTARIMGEMGASAPAQAPSAGG